MKKPISRECLLLLFLQRVVGSVSGIIVLYSSYVRRCRVLSSRVDLHHWTVRSRINYSLLPVPVRSYRIVKRRRILCVECVCITQVMIGVTWLVNLGFSFALTLLLIPLLFTAYIGNYFYCSIDLFTSSHCCFWLIAKTRYCEHVISVTLFTNFIQKIFACWRALLDRDNRCQIKYCILFFSSLIVIPSWSRTYTIANHFDRMYFDIDGIRACITSICFDIFSSGNVDEEVLDTLCQVEVSELCCCRGEQYSKYSGSRTKSRRYQSTHESYFVPFFDRRVITQCREYVRFWCKDVRSWTEWGITWCTWPPREDFSSRFCPRDGASTFGENSITSPWTIIS